MRKPNPIVALTIFLALAASIYVGARVVLATDGPCAPKEPTGAP